MLFTGFGPSVCVISTLASCDASLIMLLAGDARGLFDCIVFAFFAAGVMPSDESKASKWKTEQVMFLPRLLRVFIQLMTSTVTLRLCARVTTLQYFTCPCPISELSVPENKSERVHAYTKLASLSSKTEACVCLCTSLSLLACVRVGFIDCHLAVNVARTRWLALAMMYCLQFGRFWLARYRTPAINDTLEKGFCIQAMS